MSNNAQSQVTQDASTSTQQPHKLVSFIPKQQQRTPSTARKISTISQLNEDSWLWESISTVVALASTVAIFVVLICYNGKTVPQLPYGVTLNALISVLATIARLGMALIVESAISQDKWLYFLNRPRPLADIQILDDASRGPLGALQLFSSRFCRVAGLAGLITLLASLFDPFTQQVIVYRSRNIASKIATPSLPYATAPYLASDTNDLAFATIQGILGSNTSSLASTIPMTCPGGNCTFPAYETVGYCSQCKDITAETQALNEPFKINFTDIAVQSWNKTGEWVDFLQSHTFRVPNWPTSANVTVNITGQGSVAMLDGEGGLANYAIDPSFPLGVTWDLQTNCPTPSDYNWCGASYAGVNRPDVALGVMSFEIDMNLPNTLTILSASECALTSCVQTVQRSSSNGKIQTNITNAVIDLNDEGDFWNATINGTNSYIETKYSSYTSPPMLPILQGTSLWNPGCSLSWTGPADDRQANVTGCFPDGYGALTDSMGSLLWNRAANGASVSDILANVATAASVLVQSAGGKTVEGTAWNNETYVHVRWGWIALPASLVLLACVALGLTIWQTSQAKMALWRSSLFPLLYRHHDGREGTESADLTLGDRVSSFARDAEECQAVLRKDGETGLWVLSNLGRAAGDSTGAGDTDLKLGHA